MKLKKILIYSRHGQRYPLFNYEKLKGIITKEKINWEFENSILTPKGEILEYEFGKYLIKYISNLDIDIKTKEIYTNSLKRTVLTAKILSLSMFPFEDISVKYNFKDLKTLDNNFNINISEEDIDRDILINEDKRLENIYYKLENILGIEKGTFLSKQSELEVNNDGLLCTKGAFNLATDIVDMYIIKYFENFPEEEIFKSNNFIEDLKELSKIRNSLLDITFANKEYIKKSKKNAYNLAREYAKNDVDLSILVGHDSNFATILSALEIDTSNIGNIFEKYPIGGKLVFKIYEDDSFDLDLLYFDADKIRNLNDKEPVCVNLGKNLKFKDL